MCPVRHKSRFSLVVQVLNPTRAIHKGCPNIFSDLEHLPPNPLPPIILAWTVCCLLLADQTTPSLLVQVQC